MFYVIEHIANFEKEVNLMKKDFDAKIQDKIALGKAISKLRFDKSISLRQLSKSIGIPPSNLTYIESGVNAPTADIYKLIIQELSPTEKQRKIMDGLYMNIRQTPPPDVCNILMVNNGLGEKIRLLQNVSLTSDQLTSIEELFTSFTK